MTGAIKIEYVLWTLFAIAAILNVASWRRGPFLGLANLAAMLVIYIGITMTQPAHAQYYPRWDPEQHRVAPPQVQPQPLSWKEALRRCGRNMPPGPLHQEQVYTCARRLAHPEWYGDR